MLERLLILPCRFRLDSDTEKSVVEFDQAMKNLRSFSEFKPFERWMLDQIESATNKMLNGRKEESMRELAREVKTYKRVLGLFKK